MAAPPARRCSQPRSRASCPLAAYLPRRGGAGRRAVGLGVEVQAHVAVELALVGPAFVHLHRQEQVHRAVEDLGELLARLLADPLQGLAALAQHDRALALALDVDGLLDAGRAVAALLELG